MILVNKAMIQENVMFVLSNLVMKKNLVTVQKMIEKAPGNAGGAKILIDYYQKTVQ